MSQNSFPVFFDQGASLLHCFSVDGSAVSSSGQSTAGLDGRGSVLATISKSLAVQTVVFNQAMINCYIFLQPITANAACTLAKTTNASGYVTGFTMTGQTRDAHGTPLNDIDWDIYIVEFKTTQYVS